LGMIVQKTGGEQEKAAFAFLSDHVDQVVRDKIAAEERMS
jgi:hypothetical protein